ncbi:MAG TPA: OB-fold nucleic acid binding domain-containing protein [Terriglobia bacterium]|nr:OB-fold nucleic acid binding domain-containing protein [Terriglobia bacterium]
MKEIYVSDLQPNQIITSSFLVQSKDVRFKKTGEGYLALCLSDKTGEVEAKIWENVEEYGPLFERDDFVKVKGAVQVFRKKPQLTVHKLRRLEDHEVDLSDFFPRSARDPEEMWQELQEVVAAVRDPHLHDLLSRILQDPEIAGRLRLAPAAKSLHHAYIGGLLEHILSLCRLARLVLQNYAGLNEDLVIAGVLLHDLGKIYELSYSRSFGYTSEGQLLGHMTLEIEILHKKLAEMPGFPRPLQTLLEHLIISHHGHYEFGSPKLPMFPEALLLHYIDDLDSKLQGMQALIAKELALEGEWTGFFPSLGRPLLKVSKFLSGEPASPAAADTATTAPED